MGAFDDENDLIIFCENVELAGWGVRSDLDGERPVDIQLLKTHSIQQTPDIVLELSINGLLFGHPHGLFVRFQDTPSVGLLSGMCGRPLDARL